jgi:hypothetical protein
MKQDHQITRIDIQKVGGKSFTSACQKRANASMSIISLKVIIFLVVLFWPADSAEKKGLMAAAGFEPAPPRRLVP